MSEVWSDRLDAIRNIERICSGEDETVRPPSDDACKLLLEKMIDRFDDPHAKVQEAVLKLLNLCYLSFENFIFDHLNRVFLKVVYFHIPGCVLLGGKQRNTKKNRYGLAFSPQRFFG